jgi:predicted RNA binding protein YcfA (HicA-like mRNA interferase family)
MVKRQELEAALRALGWYFLKHGGSHDLWAHAQLARSLLRQAELPD